MTVLEAIQKSAEFLGRKSVASPRLQTELLLAHLLKLPRLRLYLEFERALTNSQVNELRQLVRRRGQHEPLQHLTGTVSFCGLEIAVNRHALVPRPETELLAELGWQFLLAAPKRSEGGSTLNPQPSTALDFGTGTGCIAIALAAKCPDAKITATDISGDALALAGQNAAANQVAERIEFLRGDGFAALQPEGREPEGRVSRVPNAKDEPGDSGHSPQPTAKAEGDSGHSSRRRFDLIISNPPYIPSAEITLLPPEVRDYDPPAALDGGADGLDFYRRFASQAKPFLNPGGKMMLELGDGQAEAVRQTFEAEKWIVEAVREDYSHRARILIAQSSSSSSSSS